MREIATDNPRIKAVLALLSWPSLWGGSVSVVGGVVILGWLFNIPALTSVFSGLATMKFNTALLFVLLGLSLIARKRQPRLAQLCATIAVLIALITLAEYTFGGNARIDELLLTDKTTRDAGGAFPGRMSIVTAVNFALFGSSLLLLKQRHILAQLLTLVALALTLVALAGYLYNAESLRQVFPYSTLALHTAGNFVLLGVGILLTEPTKGVLRILFSEKTSGIVMRRLLPIAILLPIILGWLLLQGQLVGLINTGFGSVLFATLSVVVLLASSGWLIHSLDRVDKQRLKAEESTRQAYAEMEQQVIERTEALLKTNESLQASEAKFSGVINTAHDAIISIDDQQNITLFNQGAERIFGYTTEEAMGQPLTLLLPESFQAHHNQYVIAFGQGEQGTRIMAPNRPEVKGQRKNGTEFPAEVSISSLVLNGERIFTAVVRDVTERQEAKDALTASEQRFRFMVKNVRGYAIFMLDPQGYITSWNEGAERIKGYKTAEIVGQHFSRFYTPEDRQRGEPERVLETAEREGDYALEGWRLRQDGSRFWARIVVTAVRNEKGELLGFAKVVHDLTKRKQTEEALKKSEGLLRQVLEILPVGVWITEPDGTISQSNPAGRQIWTGAKYVGMDAYGEYKGWWVDTGEPIQPDEWAAARAVSKGEISINEEVEIECFDGTHKYILNSAIPIRDDENQLAGAIIVNSDVTNIKETEIRLKEYAAALEQSNKELEAFAYTASHDLQEPLRKIQAFGDRLQTRYSDTLDERGQDYLRRMINASTRMRALIQDLLIYSRVTTKPVTFKTVNLNDIIAGVCSDLEIIIENTQAQVKVDPLINIEADRVQMRQLFQNLISNAIKFRVEGRPPLIHISGQMAETPPLGVRTNTAVPTWYTLRVADNGIGFDNKYAERILGIFQRLHGRLEYEGTGIGLAICQKIVERHHGTMVAQGQAGQGATFIITLPVHQDALEEGSV